MGKVQVRFSCLPEHIIFADSKCTYKKDKLYSRKHIPSKTCFIYSNKLTSWFGARTECSSIGAILAIPTVDTLKATEAVDPRLGGQYWIGLHRVAWTVSDSGKTYLLSQNENNASHRDKTENSHKMVTFPHFQIASNFIFSKRFFSGKHPE